MCRSTAFYFCAGQLFNSSFLIIADTVNKRYKRIENLNPYKSYKNLIELTYPFNKTPHSGRPSQDTSEQDIFRVLLRWFLFTNNSVNVMLSHTGLSVCNYRQGSSGFTRRGSCWVVTINPWTWALLLRI